MLGTNFELSQYVGGKLNLKKHGETYQDYSLNYDSAMILIKAMQLNGYECNVFFGIGGSNEMPYTTATITKFFGDGTRYSGTSDGYNFASTVLKAVVDSLCWV